MKKENALKIFLLSQTTLLAQWTSLMGDKYLHALPFEWKFVESYIDADVIAWDGLLNPKSSYYYHEIVTWLKEGKSILLLQREAYTLFNDHPYVSSFDLDRVKYIELSSGNVLPEDLLAALEVCHKKLNNV